MLRLDATRSNRGVMRNMRKRQTNRVHRLLGVPKVRKKVQGMSGDMLWLALMDWCKRHCSCHQRADRSLFFRGYQLPLCARCTGMMVGHIVAFIAGFVVSFSFAIALLMIPLMVDGAIQHFTSYESTNFRRVVTGLLYGFAFTSTMWRIARLILAQH